MAEPLEVSDLKGHTGAGCDGAGGGSGGIVNMALTGGRQL